VRKNALIARKQGFWQGYLTCEKAEKGREISDRIGAKGGAKKGQKRRALTGSFAPVLRRHKKADLTDRLKCLILLRNNGRDGVIRTLYP